MKMAKSGKIPRRLSSKKKIYLSEKSVSIIEYLRDTDWDPELISVMADECCDALTAVQILIKRREAEGIPVT